MAQEARTRVERQEKNAASAVPAMLAVPDAGGSSRGEPTRRTVLKGGAAGAVALGAVAGTAGRALASGGTTQDDIRALASIATHGFNEVTYHDIVMQGYVPWLEEQLKPDTITDPDWDNFELANFPDVYLTAHELLYKYFNGDNLISRANYSLARLMRGIYSKKQLQDRLAEFWLNFFNIDILDTNQAFLYIPWYRDTLLPNVLGKFGDLLLATAQGPAMMSYLNNDVSVAGAPNENYARELMELHSLGAGGFTEPDVQALAILLTGRTWNMDRFDCTAPSIYGDYVFDTGVHDGSPVSFSFNCGPYGPGTGEPESDDVVRCIAGLVPTALNVGRRLCEWFLMDDPPNAVVNTVALEFWQTSGDINATVRKMLDPATIALVAPDVHPQYKRPYQFLLGAIRALGIKRPPLAPTGFVSTETYQIVAPYLFGMGQAPGTNPSPDGFRTGKDVWADTAKDRWVFANDLTENLVGYDSVNDLHYWKLDLDDTMPGSDFDRLFQGVPNSGLASRANQFLTGGTLDPCDVDGAQQYMAAKGFSRDSIKEGLALLLSSKSFQNRRW